MYIKSTSAVEITIALNGGKKKIHKSMLNFQYEIQ